MSTFESLSSTQKARAALHRDVRSMCAEACHFLGMEITKPAMEIVAELVYKKITLYGTDLEAFAKHAKRSTINLDDVKLLVRRNPSLKTHLNKISPTNPAVAKEKRRKTVALPVARQPKTPLSKTKEVEKTKEPEKSPEAEAVENMAVDNTIDLTFE